MTNVEIDSLSASNLLKPRSGLPWKAGTGQFNCWTRPFFIDNRIIREHWESMLREEGKARAALRDSIEGELAGLAVVKQRFWLSEYRFIEKILTLHQLAIYAPALVKLSRIMPRKMVFCRRMVVRKYLERRALPNTPFFTKLTRQFIRTSVLFFPSERLTAAADRFTCLVTRSSDQSRAANRRRVAMMIRSVHMMSDFEICKQFQDEDEYLEELNLLAALARHYRLGVDEIFRIPASEISHFWDTQC